MLSALDGFSKPWAKRHCDRNDSPNKTSKLWSTKTPAFFSTSQDSKDQAVQLILLESANVCWRLRIFMVIWAGISHATKHTVDLNQCLPRAMSAQGMSFPRAKAYMRMAPVRYSCGRAEGTDSTVLHWCSASFQLLFIRISQNSFIYWLLTQL